MLSPGQSMMSDKPCLGILNLIILHSHTHNKFRLSTFERVRNKD